MGSRKLSGDSLSLSSAELSHIVLILLLNTKEMLALPLQGGDLLGGVGVKQSVLILSAVIR